jgi:hypothetical protein
MMEAVRTSETSVHFNVSTRRYIREDSHSPPWEPEISHYKINFSIFRIYIYVTEVLIEVYRSKFVRSLFLIRYDCNVFCI